MVEFKPEGTWRRRGAPPVAIPPEIGTWMERTYADNTVCEFPAQDDPDTASLVRLIKLYAKHHDKSAFVQFFEKNGESHLRFKMRDKRAYRKADGLPREKR